MALLTKKGRLVIENEAGVVKNAVLAKIKKTAKIDGYASVFFKKPDF